ncbi:MAG: hypothetical protein QME96_04470 [Myxococcota bacterium]|nr:hypothetical protein [Myxococcota bacterium]
MSSAPYMPMHEVSAPTEAPALPVCRGPFAIHVGRRAVVPLRHAPIERAGGEQQQQTRS